MKNPDVTCPICGASIPLPVYETGLVNEQGLTVAVDTSFGDEHARMHSACTCQWRWGGIVVPDPECLIHAAPLGAMA